MRRFAVMAVQASGWWQAAAPLAGHAWRGVVLRHGSTPPRLMQSCAGSSAQPLASAARSFSAGSGAYELVQVEKKEGQVALITLNRPKKLNSLSNQLMRELNQALRALDSDASVGAIVITGSERAFAAGADIDEMKDRSAVEAYKIDMLSHWEDMLSVRKPVIAAVNGFALGGGCELAMMCDFILAGDKAVFGQPEINLGTIPGMGGTQRLTRAVGKSKAMDLVLTGRNMHVEEAERSGLVSRVFPAAELVEKSLEVARKIAEKSTPIAMMAKEAVNVAFETTLSQGVKFERRIFHGTFATNDQKEGMSAFLSKRPAQFSDN